MSMLSKHWVMRGCLILLSLLLIVFMYAKKIHIKVVTETDILTNCKLLALKGFYDETRETVVGKQVFLPDRIKQNVTDTHAVKARMMSFINKGIAADDRTLVDILKNYYIELPSNEPYNLNNPDRLEYSNGQTPFIDSRLNYIVSTILTINSTVCQGVSLPLTSLISNSTSCSKHAKTCREYGKPIWFMARVHSFILWSELLVFTFKLY